MTSDLALVKALRAYCLVQISATLFTSPKANHLILPTFYFLVCKMGMMMVSVSLGQL